MIHFVDGERNKFIEVQILDDAIPEGDETFQLILANPLAGLELGENVTGMLCWETLNIHDFPALCNRYLMCFHSYRDYSGQ